MLIFYTHAEILESGCISFLYIYGHVHSLKTAAAKCRFLITSLSNEMLMEAGMLSILRDRKNSKLQLTSEGASVLAYAGLTCSTTLFYATALINNG